MAKDSIRLSERHGVNPSIAVCFYCGEDSGDLILAGRLPGDTEAPRKAVWTRDPCPTCREYMRQGVILIAVRDGETGDNPYRTGPLSVITDEAIRRIFDAPTADRVIKARMCFVPMAVWSRMGLPQ